jgi:hypothetical protein
LLDATGKDGHTYRAEILFPPGFSRGGLEPEAIIAKFQGLTADRLPEATRGRIIGAVMTLDDSPSLTPLLTALAEAAQA